MLFLGVPRCLHVLVVLLIVIIDIVFELQENGHGHTGRLLIDDNWGWGRSRWCFLLDDCNWNVFRLLVLEVRQAHIRLRLLPGEELN